MLLQINVTTMIYPFFSLLFLGILACIAQIKEQTKGLTSS